MGTVVPVWGSGLTARKSPIEFWLWAYRDGAEAGEPHESAPRAVLGRPVPGATNRAANSGPRLKGLERRLLWRCVFSETRYETLPRLSSRGIERDSWWAVSGRPCGVSARKAPPFALPPPHLPRANIGPLYPRRLLSVVSP